MYIIFVWHVYHTGWCWNPYSLTECILFRNKQPTTVDEYHMTAGKPSLYQKPNSKYHEYVRVLVFYTQWRTIRYIHGIVIQISYTRKNLCLSFVHLGFQDIRLLELFVFWWVYPESWCHLPTLFEYKWLYIIVGWCTFIYSTFFLCFYCLFAGMWTADLFYHNVSPIFTFIHTMSCMDGLHTLCRVASMIRPNFFETL